MFERARAALTLKTAIGETATYVGFTGGDHILRDSLGRVWSVDLVTGVCVLCTGPMPTKWRRPPTNSMRIDDSNDLNEMKSLDGMRKDGLKPAARVLVAMEEAEMPQGGSFDWNRRSDSISAAPDNNTT